MQITTKEVYFHKWCQECEHYDLPENDEPCDECLENGWNENSHKPVKFKLKEDE